VVLVVVVGLILVSGVVLAVEARLARTGPGLPVAAPLALDTTIGNSGPAGTPLRMLWLGDSTAAGVGASGPDGALPRQVASRLGRPVQLTVLAISGAQVEDVIEKQLPKVTALDPDVVFLSIGANDVVHFTSKDSFTSRYRRLLDQLGTTPVIALGVPDMGAAPRFAQPLRAIAGWRGRALDGRIRGEVAGRDAVKYVDIAGRTGPVMRRDPDRYFALDQYHPNEAGYGLWADAVLDVALALPLDPG
jgi:lysophospholipase L1-like esterase